MKFRMTYNFNCDMKHAKIILLILFCQLLFCDLIKAQETYTAKIMNKKQQVVEFATIVLLDSDSLAVCVGTTDIGGTFSLSANNAKYLRVSHLSYKDTLINLIEELPRIIYLEENNLELGEVIATAQKPIMKIIDGGIPSYDIESLFANTIVTNAYDMLVRLPGIIEQGGIPTLVGSSSLTIVLNGKNLNMPQPQVLSLLRRIPISLVKSAEISYNPIPKYRAEGGSVNIILKEQVTGEDNLSTLAGEVGGAYEQKYYPNGSFNSYLSYGSKNLSMRTSYNLSLNKSFDNTLIQTYPNSIPNSSLIKSQTQGYSQNHTHNALLNVAYESSQHKLSADYYMTVVPKASINQQVEESSFESKRLSDYNSQMHHFSLDYSFNSTFRAGGFYTRYRKVNNTKITIPAINDSMYSRYQSLSNQRNNVWGGYIQNEHTLNKAWQINYGIHLSHSRTNDDIHYSDQKGIFNLNDLEGSYNELSINGYLGVKTQITEKLNLAIALKGNYMDFKVDKKQYITPQIQISYVISPGTLLQMAFNTRETYPAYWERQPFKEIKSIYQVWRGNPNLRPYTTYTGRLLYLLKGKYVFHFSDEYSPKYFKQLMHHNIEKNIMEFSTQN